jgi:hypothetical protein
MEWLEIIEIRSTQRNLKALEYKLKELKAGVNKSADRTSITIYRHIAVDSDYSIHLYHDSEEANINGSPLGVNCVSALKEFGLINHSVWENNFS